MANISPEALRLQDGQQTSSLLSDRVNSQRWNWQKGLGGIRVGITVAAVEMEVVFVANQLFSQRPATLDRMALVLLFWMSMHVLALWCINIDDKSLDSDTYFNRKYDAFIKSRPG